MLAASTRLGPYEIVAPLGAGGMGEVYRARDTRLGRDVAVKVLPEPFAADASRRARFEREARAVASLSHPNILAIHDYGADAGVAYAVTELLEGETFRGRLAKGPLPMREAVEVAAAVADGLAAAHAKGVIHRDLKPENLFLTSDGRVKILDFGLARIESAADPAAPTTPHFSAATNPNAVMGTPGYMAPEQVRGEPTDARSDIFALGCVLYELVSGRRPFARPSAVEAMAATLRDDPPRLSAQGSDEAAAIERLIHRCMAKDPAARVQSAHALAMELRAALRDPAHLPRRLRPVALVAGVAAVMALVAASLYLFRPPGHAGAAGRQPEPKGPIDSLAVLPLATAGGGSDAEFLGDGITEALINRLSQISNLRVMARTTVFRYRRRAVDPREVGRELNVRAVLTGQVTHRGGAVVIQADLVDATDGAQLWGEHYTPKTADLQAVQEDIARQIATALRLKLTGEQQRRMSKRYTESTDAYQLYLKGRYFQFNYGGEGGGKKSIEYFEKAIAADPSYALAHSGLADAWSGLGNFNEVPPDEAYRRARAAALTALQLDDELAEAHTSLALIRMNHDWDWVSAEREYERALDLNPGYVLALSRYAWLLAARGRIDEGIARMKRVLELDPLSLNENTNFSWYLYMARRYDAAEAQLKKTLEMDPTYAYPRLMLGRVYEQQKRYPQAIAEHREAVARSNGDPTTLANLAYAHAIAGDAREARNVLAQLREREKQTYVSPYSIAAVHVGLGEIDEAIASLERAYEKRDGWLAGWIKGDPRFDPLRTDPRFVALLRRLSLFP